jgi:hypothetical protein
MFVPAPARCRRVTVPACDPEIAASGVNPPSVGGEIVLVKKGDIIDVGLDWSAWLEANGGKLSTSAWAAHGSSPQAPVISGSSTLIDEEKHETPVLLDLSAAAAGNVYYLTNTVVVQGLPNSAGFTMPNRTLVRVLHVKVSA